MPRLINFTNLTFKQTLDVLEWRNHPNIRSTSHNREEISIGSHRNFIDGLKSDWTKCYFYIAGDEGGLGVFSFSDITGTSAVYGCYKNPYLTTKGIGTVITKEAILYAFNVLELKTIYADVYDDNIASLKMFEKNGFIKYEKTKNLVKLRLDRDE